MEENVDPDLLEKLKKLQSKYSAMGQDISSYLDGLLYSDYTTYWDYIHLDTLLSLQTPKTQFRDEKIFIIYHQITELYFNLILWEIDQIASTETLTESFFVERVKRINRYFQQLTDSFSIMISGMERDQFLKFRMSLLPASGFQSAQYRLIEICCTDMINLVNDAERESMAEYSDLDQQLDKLYWRSGATELATGKRTLTLKQFEEKYMPKFKATGIQYRNKNLRKIYLKEFPQSNSVIECLRELDTYSNVRWPLAHLKASGQYLKKNPRDIKATGGTNWQQYLPPRFQKIIFFPELWNRQEKEEWGKAAFTGSI
ncbi:MAG: tryptophan 2,3-dioxygenase family protein [Cyclobacteriaceae bacterium]|nr:tryptophan 2,3-dioxygenase family protein [Cyclobacteriaceae bacterium]MDH4298022.1 tryptophan 2,3-dioxygenase family protein [Cyclobacteriaceae bacterium]MDH5249294.1 tryptophan 2,3-dioxygenase family protein [Cyclobacteriaceae bacterium]